MPTVWLGVADELARRGRAACPICATSSAVGPSLPAALIERYADEFGIRIVQAWGMTETSPLASVAWPQERMRDWPERARSPRRPGPRPACRCPGWRSPSATTQGRPVPRRRRAHGRPVRPGSVGGRRLPARTGAEAFTDDGWFRTGDVAVGSPDGYFVIADRTKDLIKSGGRVDLVGGHGGRPSCRWPAVAEAAVIAVPRPQVAGATRWSAWSSARDARSTVDEVRDHLEGLGFARWQLPDRVEVIDEMPEDQRGQVRQEGPARPVRGVIARGVIRGRDDPPL